MIAFSLAVVALGGPTIKPAIFKGWKVWDLQNDHMRMLVAPEIGRIVYFARKEGTDWGRNVIWLNPDLYGKTGQSRTAYRNYGGDKVWNAPQARWGWPPDPALDAGPYQATVVGQGLRLIGRPCQEGFRVERTIVMRGTRAEIITQFIADKPVGNWSIWPVCQVDEPGRIEVPVAKTYGFPNGWRPYPDSAPNSAFVDSSPTHAWFKRDPNRSYKVASGVTDAWAIAKWPDVEFRISASKLHGTGPAPDDGASIQIFSSPDPAKYMEMELPSPLFEVSASESSPWRVIWEIRNPKEEWSKPSPAPHERWTQ
jgi:hypothetical protein